MATEHVKPEPGEIAETIISSFYEKQMAEELRWHANLMMDSGYVTEKFKQQRLEEMLKRIWFLVLEQKARDGGFDD